MTDTDTTPPDIDDQADDQVEDDTPQVDVLALLTVDELNTGSRQLKASLVRAVAGESEDYERGLAVVLWLHARRTDPGAKLGPYMRLTFYDVQDQLAQVAKAAAAEVPTTPTPALS